MSIAESLLPEFDHETATTRHLLERIPAARAAWTPHPKSRSLGDLGVHIARLPDWTAITLERTEFDLPPPEGAAELPPFQSTEALLRTYDAAVAGARAVLARTSDAAFMGIWSLKSGGRVMFSQPRVAVFRTFVMNHGVHHRGQLSVYLRLLDIPVPSMYGPTADN